MSWVRNMMHYCHARLLSLFGAAALTLSALALNAASTSAAVPLPRQSVAINSVRFRDGLVYVANYYTNSVTAYPATASGDVRPSITLAGPHTRIFFPTAISSDPQGQLFVATFGGQILVFARGASGDTAPIRSFQTQTQITSIAVDFSGYTYVGFLAYPFGPPQPEGMVGVFAPAAHGAATPLRVFYAGTESNPSVAVNDAGQVYVIQPVDRSNPASLSEYSAFAAGNTLLYQEEYLGNQFQGSSGPFIAVGPRSGDVYTIDYYSNESIMVFNPQLTRAIGQFGLSNSLNFAGIAVDDAGQVYIGAFGALAGGGVPNSVEVFSAAASGSNPAPSRIINGPKTDLSYPIAITLVECAPHRGRP